jgi:selenium-binding protein 1
MPPLISDIDLSLDDKFSYVARWGTGEMRQYDVTEPRARAHRLRPYRRHRAARTPHRTAKALRAARRWSRSAVTASASIGPTRSIPPGTINSIPASPGAEVMAIANPAGGSELAKDYWVSFPEGYRAHQIRLDGGDCSTDSFCYPSA